MASAPIPGRPFLDLYSPEFRTDPHTVLQALREQSWCADTAMGLAVLRYEEVQALLTHRKFRTPGADWLALQGITTGPIVDAMSAFLLNTHGPAHDRVRRMVTRAFMERSVDAFRPRIRAVAQALIDKLAEKKECEFMGEFAFPFAWQLLFEFVGIPASAQAQVQKWNADIALMFGLTVTQDAPRIEAALTGLYAFIDELAAYERRRPSGGLLGALVAANEGEESLTTGELRAMVITLMAAGSDTVTHQLGNAVTTLVAHPEHWQRLASQPAQVPQVVEEVIRLNPAVILGVPRLAMEDLEWNDMKLSRGSCLLPVTGSANRDSQIFPKGDMFDPVVRERTHLTFGGGIHKCIGAALGRAELHDALLLLAQRLGRLEHPSPVEWPPATNPVYGPVRLPLRYEVAP